MKGGKLNCLLGILALLKFLGWGLRLILNFLIFLVFWGVCFLSVSICWFIFFWYKFVDLDHSSWIIGSCELQSLLHSYYGQNSFQWDKPEYLEMNVFDDTKHPHKSNFFPLCYQFSWNAIEYQGKCQCTLKYSVLGSSLIM